MNFGFTSVDPQLTQRVYSGCVPLAGDTKVVTVGGCNIEGQPVDTAECWDSSKEAGQQWTTLPDMPTKRASSVAYPYGNLVFVFGGISNANSPLDTIEMLDVQAQTWSVLQPLPIPMQGMSTCLRGNKILIVGGVAKDLNTQTSLLCFDPARQKYQAFPSMQSPRYAAAVAYSPVKDCLFTLCGRDGRNSTNTCEAFDFRALKWRSLPSRPTPGRIFCNWVYSQDKVYIVGGLNDDPKEGFSSLVDVFDIETETWSSGPELNEPRGDACIGLLKDHIVVVGGYGNKLGAETRISSLPLRIPHEELEMARWKDHKATLPKPHVSASFCALNNQEKLFTVGGMSKDGLVTQADIIHPL